MNHFFDVGAHNGSTFERYILANMAKGDYVWCFEPSPECWPDLTRTIERHSDQFHITILPFALSDKWDVQRLYRRQDSEGNSVFPYTIGFNGVEGINIQDRHIIKIVTVPIVDFIVAHTFKGDHITLKLDCEGCESGILDALLNWHEDGWERSFKIMVEWHVGQEMEKVRLQRRFEAIGQPIEGWNF